MKWWRWLIVFAVCILLFVMRYFGLSDKFLGEFIKRDLNCNSFAAGGVIVDCDYRIVNDDKSVTEVVRLKKIVSKSEKIYLRVERYDDQKKIINEDILIGKKSEDQKVMAVFYLNFKIPPTTGYELIGNPKTVMEFEQLFKSENLKNREAKIIVFSNQNNEGQLSSLYLYRP